MSGTTIDTDLLEQAIGRLPRDARMPARQQALARFRESGFPTTRHEDWKYTNLAPAVDLSNLWLRDLAAQGPNEPVSTGVKKLAESIAARIDAHWVVIANGVIQRDSLAALAQFNLTGLEVSSAAAEDGARSVRVADPMSLFNAALLRDALHIRVTGNARLPKPLGLLIVDDADAGKSVSQPRIVIDAGNHARARFIELHASLGEHEHFANAVTELNLEEGAAVDFVRIQERQQTHYQVGKLTARLARDSVLQHAAFDLGGALIRNDVAVDLAEPGASVTLHGLYLAGGRQHIDNHTRVDHRVGPARSVEEYRGILNDRARCVFNGKAIVHKGADGTDAHQANRNLLLSEKAEIDTKPELEIYADDVKCSHGTTVGQLDEAALFYLRSRGLSREEASRALTWAFAASIVARAPVAEAQDYIQSTVEARLQELVGEPPVTEPLSTS